MTRGCGTISILTANMPLAALFLTPRHDSLLPLGFRLISGFVMGADWFSLAISNEAALWGVSTAIFLALFVALIILEKRHKSPAKLDTKIAQVVPQEIIDTVSGKKPLQAARRDTKMRDALVFIEIGKWGKGSSYSLIAEHKTGGELPSNRMREAAKYNEVRIWGKPSHNAQHDLIPADYWKIWKIDWHSTPDGECRTERAESHSDGFRYYDLMVSKVEIENRWPSNDPTVEPDWTVGDIIFHFEIRRGLPREEVDKVFQWLREAARIGKITVWGRPDSLHVAPTQFYKPHEPIDDLHWRDFGFDVLNSMMRR